MSVTEEMIERMRAKPKPSALLSKFIFGCPADPTQAPLQPAPLQMMKTAPTAGAASEHGPLRRQGGGARVTGELLLRRCLLTRGGASSPPVSLVLLYFFRTPSVLLYVWGHRSDRVRRMPVHSKGFLQRMLWRSLLSCV